MRIIRFTKLGETSYGIVEGDQIRQIEGSPFKTLNQTSKVHKLQDVKIEIPVIPPTFYAAARNYRLHTIQAGHAVPVKADIGYRSNNALIAHNEHVIIPYDATEKMMYEGELVAVIGKTAKRVSEAEALNYVFGYTIGNDISERTWQYADATFWRSKNSDSFKPMGPWIETNIVLDDLETIVRINNEEQLRFKTNVMVFGVAKYISTISQYVTLYPGDVIWMGTEGSSPNIKDGDVVEIEITGIGKLSNKFVKEKNPNGA